VSRRNTPAGTGRPTSADIDRAQQLAVQLQALLCHIYGTGGEAFRSLNDTLQDNYLWACADVCEALVDALDAGVDIGIA
jgi:hypothetical protein